MADTKISALTELTAPEDGDWVSMVDTSAGANRKVNWNNIAGLQSGIYGDVVLYNPSKKRGFTDGADAVSSVPKGGTLVILDTWDCTVEGVIDLAYGITIAGGGWTRENNTTDYGTKYLSNVANSYGIRFNGTGRTDHVVIQDLQIDHTSDAGTYFKSAIRFDDVIYGKIDNCKIDMNSNTTATQGYGGLELVGTTYFTQINNTRISDFYHHGVLLSGGGGSTVFNHCHIKSGHTTNAGHGIDTTKEIYVYGGQVDGTSVSLSSGILFKGDTSGQPQGGHAIGVWCERGSWAYNFTSVDTTWDGFRIISPRLSMNTGGPVTGLDKGVLFNEAKNCTLEYPNGGLSNGVLAEFRDGADTCRVLTTPDVMARANISVHATGTPDNCYVQLTHATDTQINTATDGIDASVNDLVDVRVDYNSDNLSPVMRIAGDWYHWAETGYTP